MAIGRGEKFENKSTFEMVKRVKPWSINRKSHKIAKRFKSKRERHRARLRPECFPEYKRYHGYEW